ncbi:histone deacetylase 5-like [Brassica rapa]|uniref:histone deacetylase 5-like n=1 Tax=Brassica campestris TaxID=3711 RepID=UPI00142E7B97|nr:histone deacetylase 5-like [Brassica rapa]
MAGESRKRKVGLLYDERMCKHDTPDGEDHPECPNRIKAIWEMLQRTGLAQRCVVLGGIKAEDKHLQLVHTKEHVNLVKRLSTKKKDSRRNKIASKLDSIYLNGGSSEAAYLAAGSVVEVAEKVAEGELDCGFAIVRPPGHHAEADEAMGYCLFNNVAVAASYLVNQRPDLGIKRILIVDWDVHHGNGTQKMFWKDPRVLVFSVHRHDGGSFYPRGDDGDYDKVGEGAGEGFNINVPWEQGRCGDADYFAVWDHILIPVTKEFNPDLILVSAGFDAAIGDPLGGCLVTPGGYSVMLQKLMEFAQGKIVMALEGGYRLDIVAESSVMCVQVLLEDDPFQCSVEEYTRDSTRTVIQAVRKKLCAYWPSLADEIQLKAEAPLPPNLDEILPNLHRKMQCIFLGMWDKGANSSKQQAERLRASLEVALEEKAALQTKVAELQGEASEKLRLQVSLEKYAAEAKEAAEQLTQVCSELREVKIDLDFHRELFKKASEEKRLLEGELQKEASDKLRLRISRDRYAAEVKEAAEHLATVRSELRDVQIDLNLHRKLPKKAKKVK